MMKRYVLALIFCIVLVGCARNGVISKQEFTNECVAAFKQARPNAKISQVEELTLRTADSEGNEQTVFLDNCYAEYCRAPAQKTATIARYVSSAVELEPFKAKIDPARIVPVIKDAGWLAEVNASTRGSRGKAMESLSEPLNGELAIFYAEDSPKNIRYLDPKSLLECGIPRDQLRPRGISNLRTILPKVEVHGSNGLYMLTAGGDYEASLLLLDDLWSGGKLSVKGDCVIAIPSRDLFLVTGSDDEPALTKMRELVRKSVEANSYRITSDLFVYKDGRFTKFDR